MEQTVYSVSRFERAFQSIANHYLLLKLFGNTRLMNFFKNSSNSNESGNGTRKPWKLCVLPHSLEQVLSDLTNFYLKFFNFTRKKKQIVQFHEFFFKLKTNSKARKYLQPSFDRGSLSFEKDYHVYIYDENESYPKTKLELGTNLVLSMYF